MVDSGQMPRDPLANPDHLSMSLKEGTITEDYLSEMNHVYMEIFPSYSQIVADYDKMRHRAQVYRKKSSFPERAQWTPPGRELSDEEKEFLQGPSAQVTFLKKATIKDHITGRLVEYTAVESSQNKLSRTCCYHVAVTDKVNPPQFGRILSLFEHRFVGKTYQWAIVEEYTEAVQDQESNLWTVSGSTCGKHAVLLSKLSYPLVVAEESSDNDKTILWFINYGS